MGEYGETLGDGPTECKPLMEVCTPEVYRNNAFRVTGLLTDATVRDIKRRVDDLKHVEEEDLDEEHSHAFALVPRPLFDQIQTSALRLQDPECRIVEEFFWFWPMEWGAGKQDAALQAIANGDKKTSHKLWRKGIAEGHAESSAICKHNLAVMFQMQALDWEIKSIEGKLADKFL